MKLKFQIKKADQVTHENIVDSMEAGDAWVAQNAHAFGRGDLSLYADQLATHELTAEQAASTSEEPGTDAEGNPTTRTVYHFPKEWSVEVLDITAEVVQEVKVQDRTKAREFCLSIIDEIAAINKDLNDPQLMATIFSTPAFQSIILALLTGGTATAKALMVAHGASLYPQQTVDSLVAKMDAFIASES